jgi:hypothetical protein
MYQNQLLARLPFARERDARKNRKKSGLIVALVLLPRK